MVSFFRKEQFVNRRILFILFLPLILLSLTLSPVLVAGEKEDEGANSSMAMALPKTHKLTLTLVEAGETSSFTMTIASRHFSMNLGDKHIALRGRLWQGPGGGELLDYTLEFTQFVKVQETLEHRRGSTWNGSTHLRSGEPVEIATFLNGSFTVRLEAQE